jgi:hypothetical protein
MQWIKHPHRGFVRREPVDGDWQRELAESFQSLCRMRLVLRWARLAYCAIVIGGLWLMCEIATVEHAPRWSMMIIAALVLSMATSGLGRICLQSLKNHAKMCRYIQSLLSEPQARRAFDNLDAKLIEGSGFEPQDEASPPQMR